MEKFSKVKIWRLPLSDILTQKLTYDGVLQLTNCFIRLSADVKILSKYENLINFMEFIKILHVVLERFLNPGNSGEYIW